MRRLRDYQRVDLILEGHRRSAVVVATSGQRVWLEPDGDPQLLLASLPAAVMISFSLGEQMVLLSGRAVTHLSGCVEFRPADRGRMPNQRQAARLRIDLPVTVVGEGSAPVETTTHDLGPGGLLVAARLGPPGTVVDVTIAMPGAIPDLHCGCRVVRTTGGGTGLEFTAIDVAERDRLEVIVLTVRRRFAQAAA